jgi:tetratricopeptide (TPR) repeat protein
MFVRFFFVCIFCLNAVSAIAGDTKSCIAEPNYDCVIREAYAAVEEIDDASTYVMSLLEIAVVESKQGNDAKARSALEKATDLAKNGNLSNTMTIGVNGAIAIALVQLGEVEAALRIFRDSYAAFESGKTDWEMLRAANRNILLSMLSAIISAKIDRGDQEGARPLMREATGLANGTSMSDVKVTWLIKIAFLFLELGDFDDAEKVVAQVQEEAESQHDNLLDRADWLAFVAEFQAERGNLGEARKLFAESEKSVTILIGQLAEFEFVDRTAEIYESCASSFAYIGLDRARSGDLKSAAETFSRALEVAKIIDPRNTMFFQIMKIEDPDPMVLMARLRTLAVIGQAQSEAGFVREAEQTINQIYEIPKSFESLMNEPEGYSLRPETGQALNALGLKHAEQGNLTAARKAIAQVIRIATGPWARIHGPNRRAHLLADSASIFSAGR